MPSDFVKTLEQRLAIAKERLARANEEVRFSRSEIEYLAGLIRLEENRAALEAHTVQHPDDRQAPDLSGTREPEPNFIREFLLKALPTRPPGKQLHQLVDEADGTHVPIETGKSVARTLNANLLSMQTLKLVLRDDTGGWLKAGGASRD